MSGAVARWTAALAWLAHPVLVLAGMPMSWGDIASLLTGIVNVWLLRAALRHVDDAMRAWWPFLEPVD
jgi:hypothetical protein